MARTLEQQERKRNYPRNNQNYPIIRNNNDNNDMDEKYLKRAIEQSKKEFYK